jgi:ABC-type branched-subunit amino acid transport system substrate-binding protein
MRYEWLLAAAGIWVVGGALMVSAQDAGIASTGSRHVCECGAHPPPPPRDREVAPYAGEPRDLSPFAKFATPYDLNYTHPNIYMGAARDLPEPKNLTEVRIGFIGPIEHNPDQVSGLRMLHGAQFAVEEANARGGYGGIPFHLMLHNDYDNWQAKAVYGDDRPTDPTIWGSASNETVKMVYDDQDWAIFGSISSEATHIILRVALKAEIPVVNSASTDPTIPETYIPWYFTDLQDDRVQSYTLARRIFTELGLKRVAILRVNNRYGRLGVPKFRDASRRLGHPVVIEQKFLPGDTDLSRQLRVIQDSRADAVVLWTDQLPAARILKQMRAMGMKQRVFGSYRTLGPELLAEAGSASEGFEAVFPYDPTRSDPAWTSFQERYEAHFQEQPEQFASLAYDAMNALLDSICKAGLNRARIHDALANIEEYDGVTGHMVFDPNQKNVAPMYMGTVHNGVISYRRATMEKVPPQSSVVEPIIQPAQSYASLQEEESHHLEPRTTQPASGAIRVVLFGPGAAALAQSPEMQAALRAASSGRAWIVEPVESSQNWGAASTQLVYALMENHAVAIIATARDASHLAVQMSLKCFVPVLALSDDKTLTGANVPWVFRLPEKTSPATALALLEQASERVGVSSWKLRDLLASGSSIAGVSFEPNGELRP